MTVTPPRVSVLSKNLEPPIPRSSAHTSRAAASTASVASTTRRHPSARPAASSATASDVGVVHSQAPINVQEPQRLALATGSGSVSSTVEEVAKMSTLVWLQDLKALFDNANERFPDVVWKPDPGEDQGDGKEIWGHQAMIYARATPSFQARYFSLKSVADASSSPSTTSAVSVDVTHSASRTPSPSPPAPSVELKPLNSILRLSTSVNPTLFEAELEYLYTGQGFGEMFEFLFDSSDSTGDQVQAEQLRAENLRKDLLYMWRSRLYSDVRITLTGEFASSSNETTTAVFSAQRFILASRCPYFHTVLVERSNETSQYNEQGQVILSLPSRTFTPAALHFTLGYIYTGTLMFSQRTYDLDTAFHIMRAAKYLALPSLYDDIQARIVHEMMHGLFHASLSFREYERITAGAWATDASGCRCQQCARRAPRVLQFSLAHDVENAVLERGARRALVGMFGRGWCTSEFAGLPLGLRESLVRGVGKRTIPTNAFALLFAAEDALAWLTTVTDEWAQEVRATVLSARRKVDEVVCGQCEACFGCTQWSELIARDKVEKLGWIIDSVGRGVNERCAASAALYQMLVSILSHPTFAEDRVPVLSSISRIRAKVEQARVYLLQWIGERWIAIRQGGGFDGLEGRVLKEICDHIELPPEDLLHPQFVVVARLTAVFKNVQQYKQLLSHRDSEAQRLLDIFQTLLDTNGLSAEFRRNLLVATQRLSKRSGVYPTCYKLKDVELISEHPVAAGSFADVHKGRLLGQTVCLKVIRLYQTSHVTSFLQKVAAEAILWGQLSHPNLLPIYGLFQYTTRICLVSPWMEFGDITNFLRQRPDADRLRLVSDVARGIDYLHKDDIVHGDLKGANILVNDAGRACLADFGLSAVTDADILHWTSNSSAASKGGSVRWQAPELFDVESDDTIHNSKSSDVYAFACVAYEIFTGNIPFFEVPRDPAVISRVQMGAKPSRPPASSLAWGPWGLKESHWSFMEACWSTSPDDRPSIVKAVVQFVSDQALDDRPIENPNIISRALFRDSVDTGVELPAIDELEAILSKAVSASGSETDIPTS
ncbi:putative CAP_GLY [Lyophyllum shimeji]|uniref:CAP_GLY n=1 Tax=Lyophyllum shimeji TaxID=47721 RepID=A0A9P3UIK9_LYOSH|nr:putative CAP_GLY [Lyophyllum shimeji]